MRRIEAAAVVKKKKVKSWKLLEATMNSFTSGLGKGYIYPGRLKFRVELAEWKKLWCKFGAKTKRTVWAILNLFHQLDIQMEMLSTQ